MESQLGVSERREREKSQRRQAILEAASALFAEYGFLKVKMIDVARRCELSTGALYLYFKSKEDIFAALAIVGSEKMDMVLSEGFRFDQPMGRAELVILLENLIGIYGEYGVYFDALKNHYLGNKEMAISRAHEVTLQRIQVDIFARMVAYFETQQKFGVVASDWNLDELCFILWAQLLGVAQILGEGRNRLLIGQSMGSFLDEYAQFILSALARNGPSSSILG